MAFTASPNEIKLTDDNMVIVSGMPAFRVVGGCLEFVDKNKMRCAARGSNTVRLRIVDLAGVMRAKK